MDMIHSSLVCIPAVTLGGAALSDIDKVTNNEETLAAVSMEDVVHQAPEKSYLAASFPRTWQIPDTKSCQARPVKHV